MRTTQIIDVWREVISLHGIDPLKEVSPDLARSVMRCINKRVDYACKIWPWPEWLLTEERSFRPVWNQNDQYLRVSITDGQPDEVFYIPNTTYYKVLGSAGGDPPVGTLPTDTAFFEELTPVDTFIAYDQRCKRSIGQAIGIYSQNPRVYNNGSNCPIDFRPSERGIDVPCGTGPTVFIHYKMPIPQYTIIPWVPGKFYDRGNLALDPTVGECFQATAPNNAIPSDTSFWRRVPFLDKWMGYVTEGAFVDSMMDKDQGATATSPYDVQAKQLLVQYHTAAAEQEIGSEIDVLSSQGQKFYWYYAKPRYYGYGWCCSQPWSGGTVSTLTDVCEDELGWVYPAPPSVPQVAWQYYNQVVALRASTATPSLDQVVTRNLLLGSLAQIVIVQQGARTYRMFELVTGPAALNDPDGQVQPLDYDANNNDKHWSSLQ